jgi:hypothetical protein
MLLVTSALVWLVTKLLAMLLGMATVGLTNVHSKIVIRA